MANVAFLHHLLRLLVAVLLLLKPVQTDEIYEPQSAFNSAVAADLTSVHAIVEGGARRNSNAVLSTWGALAASNVCWRFNEKSIIRRPIGSADESEEVEKPCRFLAGLPQVERGSFLHHRVNGSSVGTVWMLKPQQRHRRVIEDARQEGSELAFVRRNASAIYKYCPKSMFETRIPQGPVVSTDDEVAGRFGILVLLTEAHGNNNIGHALRDALFLAHVMRLVEWSQQQQQQQQSAAGTRGAPRLFIHTVLVADSEAKTSVIAYRKEALAALLAHWSRTSSPPFPQPAVAFLNHRDDSFTGLAATAANTSDPIPVHYRGEHQCSRLAVLKLDAASFDFQAADFYRESVWRMCGVDPSTDADTVLIEQHGRGTRRWSAAALRLMVASLRASPIAGDRRVSVEVVELSNLTFCAQVQRFARSKLVIAHYGAATTGNGIFMRNDGLMIEANNLCGISGGIKEERPALCNAGNQASFFEQAGRQYLGACMVYGVNKNGNGRRSCADYMYNPELEVAVDEERWREIIRAAEGFLIWGRPPKEEEAEKKSSLAGAHSAVKLDLLRASRAALSRARIDVLSPKRTRV